MPPRVPQTADAGERKTAKQEVAGSVEQLDDGVGLDGDVDEGRVPQELKIAACRRGDRCAVGREKRREVPGRSQRCAGPSTSRELCGDGGGELADAGDDLRQLNRSRDMVNEIDQYAEIQKSQGETHGDRHMRHEVRMTVAHRAQRQDRVEEGRDERPERELDPRGRGERCAASEAQTASTPA